MWIDGDGDLDMGVIICCLMCNIVGGFFCGGVLGKVGVLWVVFKVVEVV